MEPTSPRPLDPVSTTNSHTESVTASTHTGPRRSGPDIRAALAEHAPSELPVFEREFQLALAQAADSFDTGPLERVITHWWQIAAVRSIHLSEAEEDQLRRAGAGDYTGLLEQTSDGTFRRIA